MVSRLGGKQIAGVGSGALAGAASGAAIGSAVPGIGTALGAGVGGLAGAISGYFGAGKKEKFGQQSTLTPQQQAFQNQQLQQLQSGQLGQNYNQANNYYSKILSGDPEAYNQFAAPYLQNFEQQIIPRLSERFAGLGGGMGGGTMGSSGFGQAIGGAGAGLQAQLAQLHAGLRQNAAQQTYGQYNQQAQSGLGRSVENIHRPETAGLGPEMLMELFRNAGPAASQYGAYKASQGIGGNQQAGDQFSRQDYNAMEAIRNKYYGG